MFNFVDVGPVIHVITSGMDNNVVLEQLQRFKTAVNNLRAVHGGDFPEYALDAMLAALDYSTTDDLGNSFQPMHHHSSDNRCHFQKFSLGSNRDKASQAARSSHLLHPVR